MSFRLPRFFYIDNTVTNLGSGGDTIATDELATLNGGAVTGVKVQRVKVGFGVDSVFRDVDASNGLPVSVSALPLPTGAAQDGTDITTPTAMPTGGIGMRGWLSAIWTKLNGTLSDDVIDRAARLLGVVTQQAITKGTQGANGVTTQDLKDAGRNQVHYYTLIPVLTSATDTLQSLTGTKAGATVTATTTPAVVTTGKIFRVTRLAATYVATAVSGYGIVRLRYNTAGVAAITSPVAATLLVGSGAPVTANSTASEEATLDEGWEFAAGVGVGISVQGFAAVTPTAVGYVLVSLTGYEY